MTDRTRHRRKLLLTRVVAGCAFVMAVSVASKAAHATDWYILNAAEARCQNAAQESRKTGIPGLASPGGMRALLMRDHTFKDLRVYRDNAGQLFLATVESADGIHIMYWVSLYACEVGRKEAIREGGIATPEELK